MLKHLRARWPDLHVPPGEPIWLLYELDEEADAVLRSAEVFPDGSVTRNSIEIEERGGKPCPSLIEGSLPTIFQGVTAEEITSHEFDATWARGVDTPFWNVS
ncbi:hypothetical protein IWC96_12600 [Brevundimonas sp. BAL450]|uniref:DUF6881 domain-containing protein n=1 Tax=Brevundimonas TaxID=41275 RepID=UPI0005EC6B29|nr:MULTISPECIES: hypothetical protein [Brevundimonas]MBG7616110.1 hypothetical protein [Brevundimonas sp. BAL450]